MDDNTIKLEQHCPLCGAMIKDKRISFKMDDIISRKLSYQYISKFAKEYREKGEDDLADGMILASRYVVKTVPALAIASFDEEILKNSHLKQAIQ